MDQIQIPTWLAVLLALAVIAQAALFRWHRGLPSRRARRRARRAIRGESDAEPLLRRLGYRILERQARAGWRLYADGEPVDVQLRADLLVAHRGRRFVAEVKTGERAPRLQHGSTRRQLLEYGLAFGVDGVLLVDPEGGLVREIVFEARGLPTRRAATSRAPWLVVAAGLGAAAAWLLQ